MSTIINTTPVPPFKGWTTVYPVMESVELAKAKAKEEAEAEAKTEENRIRVVAFVRKFRLEQMYLLNK